MTIMKNYIFDLYGTLVDIHTDEQSEKFRKRFTSYLNKIGVHTDFFTRYFELCDKLSMEGGADCEIELLNVFRDIVGEERAESAATRFRALSTSYIRVYRGVRKYLRELKAHGAKLYILSNAQSCFTVTELKKLKLNRYFDGIELSSDFGKKKPDKCFFEHLLHKYSLDVRDSIYVGNDICCDVEGASGAHMRCAYVFSNLSPETDTLVKACEHAEFATDSHKKLFEYLLSLIKPSL